MNLPLLTASRMKSYRACPRQHYHAYVQGIRPVRDAEALSFGTAVHEALAAWWSTGPSGAFELALQHLPESMEPFARARAVAMLMGYDAFWRAEGFEALEIEKEFTLPLINPETGAKSRTWQLAGKLDAIVRGPDGRVWVLEHKTTSEDAGAGSAYRDRLTLDGQVSQYIEGAEALGYAVSGVLYDVLRKPTIKPLGVTKTRKTAESAEEYLARCVEAYAEDPSRFFSRIEVVRLEADRREFAFDVWQLGELMRASARTGIAPRNPDACVRYGTPCAYRDVCTGRASLDDPHLFRRTGPSPERTTSTPNAA